MRNQVAFLSDDSIVLVSLVDGQFAPNVDVMASCTEGTTQIYRGDYIYTVDAYGTKIWTLVGPNTIHPARQESSVSIALDRVHTTLPPALLNLEVFGYATIHSTITDITGPININGSLVASWTAEADISGSHMSWAPDASGSTVTDVSGSTTDVSGTDVSGSATDISGSVTDVSGSTTDVSGSTTDVSGSDVSRSGVVTYASPTDPNGVSYVWTTDGSGNSLLTPVITTRAPYMPHYHQTSRHIPYTPYTPPTTLPRHVVNLLIEKAIAEEVTCPITSELIQSTAAVTSCGHIFNRTALMTWLATNRTCPTCRAVCTSS
jgi:hypothetical protein